MLLDRLAKNRYICFVLTGSVEQRLHGAQVGTRGPGGLVNEVTYFDGSLLCCDVIGVADGVLAGFHCHMTSHDTVT